MTKRNWLHNLFVCDTTLICKLCDHYLTVVPIHFVDNIGHVCGRCTWKAKDSSKSTAKFHRQTILEALLKEYYFPCSNKHYGCKVTFKSDDDVLGHESECEFQKEICPLSFDYFDNEETCKWTGKTEEFVQHVEQSHADLIEDNTFKLILKNDGKNYICFNRIDSEMQLFTLVLKYFKENVYYFMVMLHGTEGDSQCYTLNFKMYDQNEETYLTLHKNNLVPLRNFANCFDSTFNEKMIKIDFKALEIVIQIKDQIILKFDIAKKSASELKLITSRSKTLLTVAENIGPELDQMVLKSLKCTKCNLFMTGEIYKCANNHSKCGKCKSNATCTLCESDVYIRDKFLEKISADTFLCANRSKGCTFASNSEPISNHEQVCKLRTIKCNSFANGCAWTGPLNSLSAHFLEKHKCTFENDSVFGRKINREVYSSSRTYYVSYLTVDDQIFTFFQKLNLETGNFLFNVAHYEFENTRYKFLFRIFHASQPDICVTIPGSCTPYKTDDQLEDAVVVTSKMLQTFPSSDLNMVLKIFKASK